TGTAFDTDLQVMLNDGAANGVASSCTTNCAIAQGDRVVVRLQTGELAGDSRLRGWAIACDGSGGVISNTLREFHGPGQRWHGPIFINSSIGSAAVHVPLAQAGSLRNLVGMIEASVANQQGGKQIVVESGPHEATTPTLLTCTYPTASSAGARCDDLTHEV